MVGQRLSCSLTNHTIPVQGSLTTPPCTEGILWHVLATPMKISQSLLTKYQEAVGDVMCHDKGQHEAAQHKGQAQMFKLPADNAEGCHKMANGGSYTFYRPGGQMHAHRMRLVSQLLQVVFHCCKLPTTSKLAALQHS